DETSLTQRDLCGGGSGRRCPRHAGMLSMNARDLERATQTKEEATAVYVSSSSSHVSPREYLNSLVQASSTDTDQVANIVFVKTHKTCSSTLASMLEAYGQRHRLKRAYYHPRNEHVHPLKQAAPEILEECGGRVDVMVYHVAKFDQFALSWDQNERLYRDIMRDPENINYVTIFRDPREQLVSFYYYFIEHKTKQSIGEFLASAAAADPKLNIIRNPLARELGVRDAADAKYFVQTVLPTYKLVMLHESFDRGLLVLRRLMRWHMIDIVHVPLNKSKPTVSSWRTKHGVKTYARPHYEDLPLKAREKIDELTVLDRILYEGGKVIWEKTLNSMAGHIEADQAAYNGLMGTTRQFLKNNRTSLAHELYDPRRKALDSNMMHKPFDQDETFPF
ncbi:unnamed protein product, partial [Ectocarpus sp. 8 AP-2014]